MDRMRKGQSLIIQFILFFMIGLSLFLGVGSFFRYQSDVYKVDTSQENLLLVNSYISSVITAAYLDCKQCDNANITVKTMNTTSGNYFTLSMGSYGLNVSIPFTSLAEISSTNNFNASVAESGLVASIKPVTVTFNRTQNQITIN